MQVKEWIYNNKNVTIAGIIPQLLATRGIITEKEQKEFLSPLEMTLTSPMEFQDMEKALERISFALDNKQKILVYGDFDTDGMTAVSVLYKTLKELNGEVEFFIPNRETEGHGMNTKTLVKLLTTVKPKLIITVDCGVSNLEEVEFLNSFKVDTIITDHHESGEVLPNAVAIINPKSINALSDNLDAFQINSLTSLAGVGVAFKLAQALLTKYNHQEFVHQLIPFVAIGTIGDVVPLIGENRYFVKKGLEQIEKGNHAGIFKLLKNSGYKVESGITAEQVAFGIVPRLNASGRLGSVECAMKVLLSDNPAEITISLTKLEELNKIRQELCSKTFEEAKEMLECEDKKNSAIILYNPEWEVGIIGIAASKVVETYYKPAFLMTYSESTKQIKCSARGVDELNLYEIISYLAEDLDGYGGHKLAGGFSFSPEYISFESVKEKLNKIINEMTEGKQPVPKLRVDMELTQGENGSGVDTDLIECLKLLEPYGACNPSPVFVVKDLILEQKTLMGDPKIHLKFFADKNGEKFQCIRWGLGDIPLNSGDKIDIAFSPQINIFNDVTTIQLIIKDIHSEKLETIKNTVEDNSILIYDNRKKTDILNQVESYIKTTKMSVKVFVENKNIIQVLKPYKHISSKIFTRINAEKCDVVMFFDYPSDEDLMIEILNTCNPKSVHYMRYDYTELDATEFIKTVSGMVKFADNHRAGEFNYTNAASYLSVSEGMIKTILDCFDECGLAKITMRNENSCTINYLADKELSAITNSTNYQEFNDSFDAMQSYRTSLIEGELSC